MLRSLLTQLRVIGFFEGVSYLLLLGIAMPIKYFAHDPVPVKIVGMIHGVLFTAFVVWVLLVGRTHGWPFKRYVLAAMASIVPFGTFVFDRTLRHDRS